MNIPKKLHNDNTEEKDDIKPGMANSKVSKAIVLADLADMVKMMTGISLVSNS